MNPIFSLKNFRSFGEDGADFELAPITILTGRNSAGKSSLVKALVLLSQQSEKTPADLDEPNFEITKDPIGAELPIYAKELCLGNFDAIINKESKKDKVEFSYIIHSNVINEKVRVIKTFQSRLTSVLSYGYLLVVRIERLDGTEIYGFRDGDADRKKEGIEAMFNSPWINGEIVPKDKWESFLTETLRPAFLLGLADKYINSSSAVIKRVYSVDDSDKISVALRKLFDRARSFVEHASKDRVDANDIDPTKFVNRWIRKFEIGNRIAIRNDKVGGQGQYLYLYQGKKRRLLADEGYGITQLFALILQIANNLPYHDFKDRNKERWICVEEPEVHLHPAYQSLLADLFVEAYLKYNIHFIIETHSEYLIRRLQVLVADKDIPLTPNKVSLNYVEKEEKTRISTNRQIKILEDGRLSEPFGTGFLDEASNRAMDLLLLKVQK